MTFHVMIIPTLNCPSNCKYCWGSENTKEMMDIEIIDQIIDWLDDFRDDKVHFTFHGGHSLETPDHLSGRISWICLATLSWCHVPRANSLYVSRTPDRLSPAAGALGTLCIVFPPPLPT